MNEREFVEALDGLLLGGHIELDDAGEQWRVWPAQMRAEGESPQDLSDRPADVRRRCEGDYPVDAPAIDASATARRPIVEIDVPLPFDATDSEKP